MTESTYAREPPVGGRQPLPTVRTMTSSTSTPSQILAYRLWVNHLALRLDRGHVDEAAFVGLQDSVPRSALLSLHARVEEIEFESWDDSGLVQVWGPRGAVYVISRSDFAVFTLGRLPRNSGRRRVVEEDAARIRDLLGRADRPSLRTVTEGSVRRVREAAASGTIGIRWDGSRIDVWSIESPDDDAEACRRELARRYFRAFGPSTPPAFAIWAGIDRHDADTTFERLRPELVEVRLGGSVRWIPAETQDLLTAFDDAPDTTRVLPPGDAYLLTRDRALVVPDPVLRSRLWPQRNVPPGGVLLKGELVGTWRRHGHAFTISSWRVIPSREKELIEAEVAAMPPLATGQPSVTWTAI